MPWTSTLIGTMERDQGYAEEILKGLIHLKPGQKADMARELSLDEQTTAVQQRAKGQVPGIDVCPSTSISTSGAL